MQCLLARLIVPFGLATSASFAQSALPSNAAELARAGDPVFGGATVTGFTHLRTNDAGDWAAIVLSTGSTADKRIFFNQEEILRIGQVAPMLPGETVDDIRDIDLSEDGHLSILIEISTGFVLYHAGNLVLQQGDPADLPTIGSGTTYEDVFKVNSNATGELALRCVVRNPSGSPMLVSALVGIEVDSAGTILEEGVGSKSGDVLPGQTSPLLVHSGGDCALSAVGAGEGSWAGRLIPSATPGVHVAYRNDTLPIYQGGRPSPVSGRTYEDVPLQATAVSDTGSWAISARLDASNLANDEVIVVDGATYAREGGNLLAFPGAPVIESIGFQRLFLTDSNEPVFFADVAGDTSTDEGIVRGGHVLLRKGDLLATGATISDMADIPFGFHASQSGQYLLAQVQVDGGAIALVYVEDTVGAPYCAAENNSTGMPAVTTAHGVALADANAMFLYTQNAPPLSFGYYISSMTAGNVLFPSGSAGRLCLSGSIGRHIDGVGQVTSAGTFLYQVDLDVMPTSPNVAVLSGDTWHHQMWFRDSDPMGPPTSNFSLPVRVTYR